MRLMQHAFDVSELGIAAQMEGKMLQMAVH